MDGAGFVLIGDNYDDIMHNPTFINFKASKIKMFLVRFSEDIMHNSTFINFKDHLMVTVGVSLSRILAFLSSILIARNLSVSEFGIFSKYYVLLTILMQFPSVFDTSFVRSFCNEKNLNTKNKLVNANIYLKCKAILVAFSLFILIILLVNEFTGVIVSDTDIFGFVVVFLGFLFFNFYSSYYSYCQATDRFLQYAVLHFFQGLIPLTLLLFFYAIRRLQVISAISSFSCSLLILSIVALCKLKGDRVIPLKNTKKEQNKIWDFSKALIIANILYLLFQRMDFWLLSKFAGANEVGFYSIGIRLHSIVGILASSVSVVLYKKASFVETWNSIEHYNNYKRESIFLIGILAIFVSVLIITMGWIVKFMFGVKYLPAIPAARILMVSSLFLVAYTPYYYYFYAFEQRGKIIFMAALQLFTSVIIGIPLVKQCGCLGAALTNVAIYIVGGFYVFLNIRFKRKS